MLSRCCVFYPEDSESIFGVKFTACRKLSWCAGRLQYSAHYRYPQSFPQSVAAVIACSHYHSPIVEYGTVQRTDLAKCRQDELCCRRTIRRWNPEARGFRLMYGTPAADEKKFIHTPVSSKSSVCDHCTHAGYSLASCKSKLQGSKDDQVYRFCKYHHTDAANNYAD